MSARALFLQVWLRELPCGAGRARARAGSGTGVYSAPLNRIQATHLVELPLFEISVFWAQDNPSQEAVRRATRVLGADHPSTKHFAKGLGGAAAAAQVQVQQAESPKS